VGESKSKHQGDILKNGVIQCFFSKKHTVLSIRTRYHFLMVEGSTEGFTLARGLDPTYLPNKILILLLPFLFILSIGWSFILGQTLTQSIISSVIQLLLVFLCWAIARELDPDHDYAAFFSLPLLFHPLVFGKENILILFWFVIALRILNQTTGKRVSSTDMIGFVFLTLLSVILSSAVLLIPLAISVILLSSLLSKNQSNHLLLSLPLFPSFLLFLLITPETLTFLRPSLFTIAFIAFSSILMFFITATTHEIQCTGDFSPQHLSVKRTQSAQIMGLLCVLLLSVFHDGIWFVYPIWVAIIGIGVYRIISIILKKMKNSKKIMR